MYQNYYIFYIYFRMNLTFCGLCVFLWLHKHISKLCLYMKAGLTQHPMQSILFQNLFLVGGHGKIISIKLPEGCPHTQGELKGEMYLMFYEVRWILLSRTLEWVLLTDTTTDIQNYSWVHHESLCRLI